MDVAGGVEVDSGEDEVGYLDGVGGFGEEREEGNVFAIGGVVGLVVDDEARGVGVLGGDGRHRMKNSWCRYISTTHVKFKVGSIRVELRLYRCIMSGPPKSRSPYQTLRMHQYSCSPFSSESTSSSDRLAQTSSSACSHSGFPPSMQAGRSAMDLSLTVEVRI